MIPQQKKSPEEIARLREQLAKERPPHPFLAPPTDASPTPETSPDSVDPSPRIITPIHMAEPHPELPIDPFAHRAFHHHELPHSHSPSPRTSVVNTQLPPEPPSPFPDAPTPATKPKWSRSLKKSEQGPIHVPKVQTSDISAFKRHTPEELATIRKASAIEVLKAPPTAPRLEKAPLVIIIFGYLPPIVLSSIMALFQNGTIDFYPALTHAIAGAILALLIAALIYLRYCYSRYHAAFILIALFFSAFHLVFHYFPQINHPHVP